MLSHQLQLIHFYELFLDIDRWILWVIVISYQVIFSECLIAGVLQVQSAVLAPWPSNQVEKFVSVSQMIIDFIQLVNFREFFVHEIILIL